MMNKIDRTDLQALQGGGCKKYLRRAHRGLKKGKDHVFWANMMIYTDCIS